MLPNASPFPSWTCAGGGHSRCHRLLSLLSGDVADHRCDGSRTGNPDTRAEGTGSVRVAKSNPYPYPAYPTRKSGWVLKSVTITSDLKFDHLMIHCCQVPFSRILCSGIQVDLPKNWNEGVLLHKVSLVKIITMGSASKDSPSCSRRTL